MNDQLCPSCGQPTNFDLADYPNCGAVYEKERDMFYLWYDNGTGFFDCASSHKTLESATVAAGEGMQARQHITDDTKGKNVVWANYTPEQSIFTSLVYFLDAACQGWSMDGPPPPGHAELKAAAEGNSGPLLKLLCKKTVTVYDATTGHKAVVGLPIELSYLVQDGFATTGEGSKS